MVRCNQHWTETQKPHGWVTASPQRGCVPLAKAPNLARPHCAPHLDTQLDMMSPSFFQCRNSANRNWLLNIIFITLVVESKAGSHAMNYISFFLFWTICFIGLLCSSDGKESACNAGGPDSIFLGQEDPLEKGIATHSSILAWRIPWTKEPGGYSPWGHKESDTTELITLLPLLQVLLGRNHLKAGQLLAVKGYILSSW